MKVILESPYAGKNKERNRCYAQRCMHHSLSMGESPLAFHLLYTQVLDDDAKIEREQGMLLSQEWYKNAEMVVAYLDFGVTPGMQEGMNLAEQLNLPVEMRSIIYEGLGYTGKGFKTYWGAASQPTWGHVD